MISDLDTLRLAGSDPADPALVSTGTVVSVDSAGHQVQVAVRGDTAAVVTLPAVAARYQASGRCRVLHNPSGSGRAVLVVGAVDPLPGHVLGTLTAINTSTYRATVAVLGASVTVPYAPTGTYTTGNRVWVALDSWGTPELVIAPSSETTATTPPVTPETPTPPTTVQTTAVIGPQWSGSYRTIRSAWDRWNTSRYGGRSTLYQGNGEGSGPMIGLATYGDQLTNLGATSIDAIQVMARTVGLSGAAGPATFIGAVEGSQPAAGPTGVGSTFTGMGEVEVPADVRELLRTGGARGLALVGSNYWAIAGAGNGDGMVLRVTFTRPA